MTKSPEWPMFYISLDPNPTDPHTSPVTFFKHDGDDKEIEIKPLADLTWTYSTNITFERGRVTEFSAKQLPFLTLGMWDYQVSKLMESNGWVRGGISIRLKNHTQTYKKAVGNTNLESE